MSNKMKKPMTAKAKAAPAKKPKPAAAQVAGAPADAQAPRPTGGRATPQTPRGMRDIVPSEQRYWRYIYKKVEELTAAYGYERLDTPILEETSLFVRSVGKQSDVVEKEMFSFIDKGNDNVTLRPEGTAPMVRAYINHGMVNLPQPVKLYYWAPMFRY